MGIRVGETKYVAVVMVSTCMTLLWDVWGVWRVQRVQGVVGRAGGCRKRCEDS